MNLQEYYQMLEQWQTTGRNLHKELARVYQIINSIENRIEELKGVEDKKEN